MLYLPGTCTWVFLQFHQHVGNFLDSSLVATFLDNSKFLLRLFRKKYNVCHILQIVNHRHDVLLALQSCKFGIGSMGLADVVLHSLNVAAVCKEGVARWTNLVGIGIISLLKQFASQPVTIVSRKRKALNICPEFISCYCCHFYMIKSFCLQK